MEQDKLAREESTAARRTAARTSVRTRVGTHTCPLSVCRTHLVLRVGVWVSGTFAHAVVNAKTGVLVYIIAHGSNSSLSLNPVSGIVGKGICIFKDSDTSLGAALEKEGTT